VLSVDLFITSLFWLLTLGVLFLPIRYSIICYIVAVNIDFSGPDFASATSLGIENTIKVVLFPLIVLMRVKFQPFNLIRYNKALIIWIIFVFYTGLTIIWSPYPLSGMKMLTYLISYGIMFVVFLYSWKKEILTVNSLVISFYFAFVLALLQTFVFGNLFGTADDRFTSFTSPQSFAMFIASILIFLLYKKSKVRNITLLLALLTLFLNGSRVIMILTLLIFFIKWIEICLSRRTNNWYLWAYFGVWALITTVLVVFNIPKFAPDSRLSQLINVMTGQQTQLSSIGTLDWRLGMYEYIINSSFIRNTFNILFGSGTSSGAEVAIGYDSRYVASTIDANRVLHNEYLKVLYEWGLFGLLLFMIFIVSLIVILLKLVFWKFDSNITYIYASILILILITMASENVLANSSTPAGVGYLIILSYVVKELRGTGDKNESFKHFVKS
jgi:hypothetical protein